MLHFRPSASTLSQFDVAPPEEVSAAHFLFSFAHRKPMKKNIMDAIVNVITGDATASFLLDLVAQM